MDKSKQYLLSNSEVFSIVVGFIIGIGFLAVPNAVASKAKNDAVIATALGGLSPLYFVMIAIYCCKKHPTEDILKLSKKYLGNIIGTVCNVLFMAQFVLYIVAGSNGYKNVLVTYAVPFLSPERVLIIVIGIATYVNIIGLKPLARINIIAVAFTIVLTLLLSISLKTGRYLNLLPVFDAGIKNIVKGSIESAYAYGGVEAILLIYPLMKNKEKIASISLKISGFVISIYCYIVFVTIFYLGYKVTTKALWPVLLVTESANFPFINSFRLIFLLLWSINIIKLVANEYYAAFYVIEDTFKVTQKKYKNVLRLLLSIFVLYFSVRLGNETERREIISLVIPKATLFNIIYTGVIALLIFINDMSKKKSIG